MSGLIDRLLGREPAVAPFAPVQIRLGEMPPVVYAVGDVHGCLDLYRELEGRIAAEAAALDIEILVILLGDFVDRGPASAATLDHLSARPPAGLRRHVLMGNHEEKMLAFLEQPNANRDWLSWGGFETLMSYGMVPPDAERGFDLPEKTLRHLIAAHVPEDHFAFLRDLPLALRMGRYFLCHAGIDPGKPIAAQTARDLMWTREMADDPPDGLIVVHGHTPVERADAGGRYINVDTGAYASGRLSAARLCPDAAPEIVEVT